MDLELHTFGIHAVSLLSSTTFLHALICRFLLEVITCPLCT